MKNLARTCALGLIASLLGMPALAGPLSVEASKTIPVRLTGAAASVVLGNRNIADVAVHDENLIFITGKSFGTTNLMVFDRSGKEILSTDVVVTVNSSNMVTINRSGANYTYDCAPACRSVASPGDDDGYFSGLLNQQQQMQKLTEGN